MCDEFFELDLLELHELQDANKSIDEINKEMKKVLLNSLILVLFIFMI